MENKLNLNTKKVYSGWAIFLGGLLGSFLGAGYMLSENYKTLGDKANAKRTLKTYILLMVLFFAASLSLAVNVAMYDGALWNLGMLIGLIHYFAAQRKIIKGNGTLEKQGFLKSLIVGAVSFAVIAIVFVLVFLLFLTEYSNDKVIVNGTNLMKERYEERYIQTSKYPQNFGVEETDRFNFRFVDNLNDPSRFCFYHELENKENGSFYAANQNRTGHIDIIPDSLDDCDSLLP